MPGKLIYFSRNVHMTKNLKNYTGWWDGACCMKAGKDIKQQQESAEMKSDNRDDRTAFFVNLIQGI